MESTIDLPMVVLGRPIWPEAGHPFHELDYESGVRFRLAAPQADEIEALCAADRFALHGLHFQDIIAFFARVARFWALDNRNHPLYRQAAELLSSINGYSKKMAQRELNAVASLLRHQAAWHDVLDAELGNRFYLEEWIPRGDALVHAQPKGRVLNVLVGNVPVSGVVSMMRSCITKNQTVAKLARRDPVTPLFFVLSCLEVDENHPVSRSLSVMYWPGGDDIEEQLLGGVDAVCVWGGYEAVRSLKARVPLGVDVLEFGPRTSIAVVGRESAGSRKVGIDLAHDVALYDQEACFSPQVVFVEGEHEVFVEHLRAGLTLYEELLPKASAPLDVHAHVWRSRLEALYDGSRVVPSIDTRWTIIVVPDVSRIQQHPLSRVVYVVPVREINECLPSIGPTTQTVAVSPWSRQTELREEASLRGATKLTEIGLVETFRVGATHDGMYPLQRLVRWPCVERGSDYCGKYVERGPIDTTKWLMMNASQLEHVPELDLSHKRT